MGCTASQEKTVDVNYAIMKNPPPPAANTANQYYVKQPP